MPNKKRTGLRLRCEKGVNEEVRNVVIYFCQWLRNEYDFPIRVVIYLKKAYRIKTIETHELVTGSFFGPFNKNEEPYIRVATGDFDELVQERGKIDAFFAILETIAHEIVHYCQWHHDEEFNEEEAEFQSKTIVDRYAETLEDI
ncbi:hypothetical protein [Sporolactobacillus laevolacticus]|uniref:Uncharacterized protein n=1 Tax=Sporolactobacillus laevolacticus DSM 442 TaxID=1395513 RepID=V6IVA8_9BACL|nr:hypothetical protein [Sporolactobacillus laevolacticus]EST10411.1 hypothetical protein P343_17410 [Sporolactobacillus laevolacticus DSM 442]